MRPLLFIMPFLLLLSCSVQKRRYQRGFYVDWHHITPKKEEQLTHKTKTQKPENKSGSQWPENLQQPEAMLTAVNKTEAKTFRRSIQSAPLPEDTCDMLVFRDGSEIRAKVLEIGTGEIKYRRCDNMNGPIYTSKKSDLFMIKYANGTREVMRSDAPPQQLQIQRPNPNVRNYHQDRYRKVNHPLAIASLALACFAIAFAYILMVGLSSGLAAAGSLYIIPFLAALAAVVSGKIAMNRIREQPDVFKGKGFASPGFIMGLIIVGIYLTIGLVLLLSLGLI